MKKQIEERFMSLTLSGKMILLNIVLIGLPLLLVGGVICGYMYHSESRMLYENTYQKMRHAFANLNIYYGQMEELRQECQRNYAIQRLCAGYPKQKDYGDVKQMWGELIRNNPIYENICLVQEENILIQSGTYIEQMDPHLVEKAEYVFQQDQNKEFFWVSPSQLGYSSFLEYEYQGDTITYVGRVRNFESSRLADDTAILCVTLKEEMFYDLYGNFFDEETRNTYITDEAGYMISAKDKEFLGNQTDILQDRKEPMPDEGTVSIRGNLYLYQYSSLIHGYIVNVYSYTQYFKNIILFGLFIFAAVGFCILFASVFSYIQKRLIIHPLFVMTDKFQKMEEGNWETIECRNREDEIGILQQSFNKMIMELKNTIEQTVILKMQNNEIQLQALISQINPHFLYNTLDSIHWKAIRNKDHVVAEQIMALSDVYRYVLSRGKEFITLREEVCFQEKYLSLMKHRYGDRLRYVCEIEDELKEYDFPKLLLQPFVENAIIHGIEPKVEGGSIHMLIALEEENLKITVEDDGVGFGSELNLKNDEVEQLEESFALKNINIRLKLYYKNHYSYTIWSAPGRGCRVEVKVRLKELTKADETDGGR